MPINAKSAIAAAIVAGVKAAAASPSNDLKKPDVVAVARQVADEVIPTVLNATNNEPWYQSRVTLGALLAAVAGVLGIFGFAFPDEMQGKVLDLVIALGPILGAGLALYGRWAAKKAIGQ